MRLELVTQGTLFVQETLLPKRRAPRLHLMFQLTGPTKTGVVSVVAKKAFGSKYAFKTLMVELPDKAQSSQTAAATATAAAARAAASTAHASTPAGASTAPDSPSSSAAGSSDQRSGADAAGSTFARPARIYIIGAPASSSSSARHLSPTALLEDLKDPLLYALKVR